MRWSQAFIPTLREDPADAEAVSHKLLIRAGFVRQLSAGHYSMLPLGQRVKANIDRIIREEMDAIGGQQFHLPAVHPAEIWKKSGRWELMGEELFRFTDRKKAENVLGMTHEEIFALHALELPSYRDLPQIWYQIQTKFRDEPRPKSGVLRVREFTMKDAYSFDIDRAGLDVAFDKHHAAYVAIFQRMGVNAIDVEASSGAMGGAESVEFMVRSPAGEDWIISCTNCDYRANLEKARSVVPSIEDIEADLEEIPTPGVRTIADLVNAGFEANRQIKTLVYLMGGDPVLVLLRGDHELLEQKLVDATGRANLRPAQPEEIQAALGALPGSLGAVGVMGLTIIADSALHGRRNMTTGANQDDFHFKGVDMARDIAVERWADLRTVREGEVCINCGGALELWRGIEVGHIFKLGTKYSETFGAMVQDEQGDSHPIIMGSYGIGLERGMAAVVEVNHDDKGIIWPVEVAPYQVVVTALRADEPAVQAAAENIYRLLCDRALSVILDDRIERPGVKFADAELVGFPYRVTVGPKGVERGVFELVERRNGETVEVTQSDLVDELVAAIAG